ncbi:MFS transporter [Streptomyces platensis]|uniref:MFS transporter n=1 Tax=Streptomyces platensis TaxID=58346 RepID=UPI003870DD07|nr:MFS transporter [Streptomyces platensis]
MASAGGDGASAFPGWSRPDVVLLTILCAAQSVLMVDVVVVNVALPSIQAELAVPTEMLQLVGVAYTGVFGSLLIVSGRVGDLYGRRRVVVTGLVLFVSMSGVCGVVQETWQLFAARAGQGLGAAMVSPNAMALLVGTFREEKPRSRALGWWVAASAGGAIAGQLVGGVINELADWRGIFLLHVPLGGVVIAVALRVLPADRPAAAPPLDLWGALLLAALLGWTSLLLADVTGGDLTWTLTGAGLTVVLLVSLVYVERRHRLPVLPGLLLKRRPVAVANAVLMLNAGATTAAIYFTTLTMQHTMGYGPLQTGLGFAPVTAVVLLTSPRAGALASRLGARLLLLIGSGVSALGLLLLGLTASPGVGYWGGVLPGLALVAAGNGLSYAPAYSLATAVADGEHGPATGLISTAQELGSAAGLAVLGPVAAALATVVGEDQGAGFLASAALTVLAGLLAGAELHRCRRGTS